MTSKPVSEVGTSTLAEEPVPMEDLLKGTLLRLLPPRPEHQEPNKRCVLFVHGLNGNLRETWIQPATKTSFLELVTRDPLLVDYDVLSFGYRSEIWRGAPINNAAVQLAAAIEDQIKPLGYESVVAVAHSMGGLVAMRYVLDELARGRTPPVSGLMLYGTPMTGSELLRIAKIVGYGVGLKFSPLRTVMNLFLRAQRQITDLVTGSEFLARLYDEWALRIVNGGHHSAGEAGRMWLPVRVVTGEDDAVVTEASGKGLYGAIDWLPLHFGHTQLVKPDSHTDVRYVRARTFLQMCRQESRKEILEPIWRASQRIWDSRLEQVIESLNFRTSIGSGSEQTGPLTTCETVCQYDVLLEGEDLEVGVSVDDTGEVWRRRPRPVCMHQVGLSVLPAAEREEVRSVVDALLAEPDDEKLWHAVFPRLAVHVGEHTLIPGDLEWEPGLRSQARWVVRRFALPEELKTAAGRKIRLKIDYESFVPTAMPHFIFSAPWIVRGANVRLTVQGSFEYLVAQSRLVDGGKVERYDRFFEDRREVDFRYDGVFIPGSTFEVRWRRKSRQPLPVVRSGEV